ncbi:succinylglutamate desuccinylase/aspartoacylase family protein [Pelagibius sp. Alg239-R121]|uniref:succinylglutamate desuccinylase/aspartoacylase family protein n=1 Tax=Pelagibius sp. Alg239-R121 TaxID=2993448 RepID=UPI0024A6EABF|nr:succinylglutamate desuccinylase/aspartoacylase family protein [Pelagibius sp. Alg239-R121]
MKFEQLQQALSVVLDAANDDAVLILDSGQPGPTVSVVALTHGNEVTGIATAHQVLEQLQSGQLKQRSGRLQIVLANYEILQDSKDFESLDRFRFEDLNRIWAKSGDGEHEYLAKERIRPYIEQSDHVIDLHSTNGESTSIGILMGPDTAQIEAMQSYLDTPYVLLEAEKFLSGMALVEYHQNSRKSGLSLVIEAGQHFDFSTIETNVANTINLLRHLEVLEGEPRKQVTHPKILKVYEAGIAKFAGEAITWTYSNAPKGFDFVEKGTQICHLNGEPVVVGCDSYIVMQQAQALHAGKEMYYLAAEM